jgi:enamine deaminase RidA (YjgF/YER057c/UK114 family)
MDIFRLPGGAAGRSRAVAFGPFVWAVAVSPGKEPDMATQTRATLAVIEAALSEAGSSKARILSATVYISDMNFKAAMDAVWTAWIPEGGWPQRACIEVGLSPGTLVEIAVVAARDA